YVWDHLDERWRPLRENEVRPGLVVLLPCLAGGYTWNANTYTGLGWNPDEPGPVQQIDNAAESAKPEEGTGSDPLAARPGRELTIEQHTQNVFRELGNLLDALEGLPAEWREHLMKAARWHDVGKAHDTFQQAVRQVNLTLAAKELWAKSGAKKALRYQRRYF